MLSIRVFAEDEIEPNNNAQDAAEIQINTEYSGVLSERNDIDIYKFTLNQPGHVTFDFRNDYENTSHHWDIELIGSNSANLYSTLIDGRNTDTVKSPNFGLGNGTYFLKICSSGNDLVNINYYIKVNYNTSTGWEAEVNDSADTANELTIGEEKKGNIYYYNDVDIYKVNIPQQGKISLDFSNDYIQDSLASWNAEIVGETDYTLYSKRVSGENLYTVSSPEYGVSAGIYYIRIKGTGYAKYVDYTIKVNFTATNEWEAEPNGRSDKATEISFGKDIRGNLYEMEDVDYYKVLVPQPGEISIKFDHDYVDCNDKYKVKLIDPSGQELFSGEVGGRNIETLQSSTYDVGAGTYFIKVEGWNYLVNYTYTFRVNYSPTSEGAANFVTRLYQVGLGRNPEPDGLNDWTNRLVSGEANAVNVVQGVLCSPEYQSKGKSNGEVVNDCYQAMLGRAADEGGYNDWVSRLESGMSVNAIFAGFVGSEEFINLCNSYGITPGTYPITEERDKNLGVTTFVSRLYTQALGRNYDVDGLNDWCGQINANTSRDNILRVATDGFFHSQEFLNKNLNNEDFVKVCYRTYLGREYDEPGLADWVGQLNRGEKTRDQVMEGFAYSPEFGNIMEQYGL